jgi:hypothetical protein
VDWFSALPLALIWEKRLLLGSIRFEFLLVIFGIGNQFRSLLLTEFFFCVFLNGYDTGYRVLSERSQLGTPGHIGTGKKKKAPPVSGWRLQVRLNSPA